MNKTWRFWTAPTSGSASAVQVIADTPYLLKETNKSLPCPVWPCRDMCLSEKSNAWTDLPAPCTIFCTKTTTILRSYQSETALYVNQLFEAGWMPEGRPLLLTYYFLYWWRLHTDTKTRVAVGKQSDGASAVPLLKSIVFAESKRPTAFEAATDDLNRVTPPLWMSNESSLVFQARCCNHPGWYLSI